MDNPASWIWVLIPLAAIGIAPFKMWLKVKEKQIGAQTGTQAAPIGQTEQVCGNLGHHACEDILLHHLKCRGDFKFFEQVA